MIKNSRWSAPDDQFAIRFNTTTEEIKGLLKNSLVVEPGSRAYIIQEGDYLGEFAPGEYTVQSFVEKLSFWEKGQTTVIICRSEILPINLPETDVVTSDDFAVSVKARCTVQMLDIQRFLLNLLGPRDQFSIADLEKRLAPVIEQTLWHSVGSRTLADVKSPAIAHEISKQAQVAINLSFQRYGIQFVEVETLSSKSEEFDEYLKQNSSSKFKDIGERAATQEMANDLGNMQERIAVRAELRDAVLSDKMDRIETKEEMAEFIARVNKKKLLREDEVDSLVDEFEQRKEDKASIREHLLIVLDLQRQAEVDQVRDQMEHQVEVRAIQSEIELSELAGEKSNVQWRQELTRQKEAAQHRSKLKADSANGKWERLKALRTNKRDDEWQSLVHKERLESLRGDVEIAETTRRSRVQLLEAELASEMDEKKLAMEKRRKDWETEVSEKESLGQMDRLQKVQDMNARFAEQEQRMKIELENLKADGDSKRELDRLQAMSGLSAEALVATASTDNAALLADMKKHESTQDSLTAQANAQPNAELNEERLRMYEKMNEAERSKADAVAEAYKMAMQAQQGIVQQTIGGLAQASTPVAPMPPITNINPTVAPPVPQEIWHYSDNGAQSAPMSLIQIQQAVKSGQITAGTMVWKTGMPEWKTAQQVLELAGNFPPPTPPGTPPV
jgi:hypothetical protein